MGFLLTPPLTVPPLPSRLWPSCPCQSLAGPTSEVSVKIWNSRPALPGHGPIHLSNLFTPPPKPVVAEREWAWGPPNWQLILGTATSSLCDLGQASRSLRAFFGAPKNKDYKSISQASWKIMGMCNSSQQRLVPGLIGPPSADQKIKSKLV